MARLFGMEYTRQQLLDHTGDISQLGGVRRVLLSGGRSEGVEAVQFRTGSGLTFLAVPGRALDITMAEHNGVPLAWRSPAGEAAAAFYEPQGAGWVRSFAGGLLTTCGLTQVGGACDDDGESLGCHGRISNTPADCVWSDSAWDGDEYRMWTVGKVRDYNFKVDNLLLTRRISAVLGQSKIWIDDVVENEGPSRSPHMILYHINAGFPVVAAGSKLIASTASLEPVDDNAEQNKDHHHLCEPPTPGWSDKCYYHDMNCDADGWSYSAMINRQMEFGFYVKYLKAQLPIFTQWNRYATREYVVGIEPANCGVGGRAAERARGTLQFIEPGESRHYSLEIGVLSGEDEIRRFEDRVAEVNDSR